MARKKLQDDVINAFSADSLTIKNFRSIDSLTLEFDRINLLIGANGSGKTTILRALSLLLEDIVRRIGPKALSGQRPTVTEIRLGKNYCELNGNITFNGLTKDIRRRWLVKDRQILQIGKHTVINSSNTTVFDYSLNQGEIARYYWDNIGDLSVNLPLIVFYPVNRSVDAVPLRIRSQSDFSRRSGYSNAFTSERQFRAFFEWFRLTEDEENEQRIRSKRNRHPHLEAVRKAFESLMPGYTNLRVERKPHLRMVVTKGEKDLVVQQLSDGEKVLLSLAGDLAKRASLINPSLADPLSVSGCILIDEIDLHLHPKWQSHVIRTLPSIFPNCQFFITSHSPIVASHAKDTNVLAITNSGVEKIDPFGLKSTVILQDIFGISERPPEVQSLLEEMYTAIDDGNKVSAIRIISNLESIIDAQDAELVRARRLVSLISKK